MKTETTVKNMKLSQIFRVIFKFILISLCVAGALWIFRRLEEGKILRQMIERLSADSRAAEILVTKSEFNETTKKIQTTIKFLEFDTKGVPQEPKYFTFEGNMIQFQALVIRFEDKFVRIGDRLRGKSAYVFMKAFILDGEKTQSFDITRVHDIPAGYKIPNLKSAFEAGLWENFWRYALDPKMRNRAGIKNAQIEAPGSLFLPGSVYTLRIEHDGGLRIDAHPIPEILRGEKL